MVGPFSVACELKEHESLEELTHLAHDWNIV